MSEFDQQLASGKVVHSSLMSFLPGVSREAREDILLANAFAQQVAWGDLDEGLETDWFRNYWRNLAALGFDGKLAPTMRRPGPDRSSLREQALAQLDQAGSPAHSVIAKQSLHALQRDEQALRMFESRALTKGKARFQLLPCAQQANGFIDLVLVHLEVSLGRASKGFLFVQSDRDTQVTDLRVETIHFNLQGFREDYRRRAEASVARSSLRAIRELLL